MKLNINNEIFEEFSLISSLFPSYRCYLVGGIVRDSLLLRPSTDIDIATSCPPSFVHSVFPDGLYFAKYGTTSFRKGRYHITIASFRKETSYLDFRHPSRIEFVSDLQSDYLRRDFTVNAIYADVSLDLIDPTREGLGDLHDRIIRMIDDPDIRLREDPLRMIRAYRFSLGLGFTIEPSLEDSISRNRDLIRHLKPEKIREEVRKLPPCLRAKLIERFSLEEICSQGC